MPLSPEQLDHPLLHAVGVRARGELNLSERNPAPLRSGYQGRKAGMTMAMNAVTESVVTSSLP